MLIECHCSLHCHRIDISQYKAIVGEKLESKPKAKFEFDLCSEKEVIYLKNTQIEILLCCYYSNISKSHPYKLVLCVLRPVVMWIHPLTHILWVEHGMVSYTSIVFSLSKQIVIEKVNAHIISIKTNMSWFVSEDQSFYFISKFDGNNHYEIRIL